MKLRDVKGLIEYNGDFYTPEELEAETGINGDFDIIVNDEEETWFSKALSKLSSKTETKH